MKTSEFITLLQKFLVEHGDKEVEYTWEGTIGSLEPENIYFSKFGTLFIDTDDNYYKDSFGFKPAHR